MNVTANLASSLLSDFSYGWLPLFYLVPPHHTYFKEIGDVPPYLEKAPPYFVMLLFIEAFILWYKHNMTIRINDAITSITGGLVMDIIQGIVLRSFEISVYVWIHDNYSIMKLPWDSPITWWACFLGYDFLYYWFHRMAHEVNIFWSAHQMHHSSEDYNLSTALRQSALQKFTSWFFYMPLAFFIPPTQYIVHRQFNLLYQFWIHTEIIKRLGPIEYILNTPSHHRVHHGRNRYCIDKNYGGVFIFWDIMFGTFRRESDKVYYGLVHPVGTFNPITLQLSHFVNVIKTTVNNNGLYNKLSVLFKGPGWYLGTPRLGYPEDIPVTPSNIVPYNNIVSIWIHIYCICHFIITMGLTLLLDTIKQDMLYITSLVIVFFLFYCFTNIGMIYDRNPIVPKLEVIRLLVLIVIDQLYHPHILTEAIPELLLVLLQLIHLFSLIIWIFLCYKQYKLKSE